MFTKEIREGDVSNEFNFLNKLFEINELESKSLSINERSSVGIINEVIKLLVSKIGFNSVDLDKLFSFMALDDI